MAKLEIVRKWLVRRKGFTNYFVLTTIKEKNKIMNNLIKSKGKTNKILLKIIRTNESIANTMYNP